MATTVTILTGLGAVVCIVAAIRWSLEARRARRSKP
jgi:hypothetical protein